jgi:hypothetical protein
VLCMDSRVARTDIQVHVFVTFCSARSRSLMQSTALPKQSSAQQHIQSETSILCPGSTSNAVNLS